jgi:ATP-binding cassette subfamily B protein
MSFEHFEDDAYKGHLDLPLWRRIARHARPYRRELAGLGGAGAVIAMVDVLFPLVTGRVIDQASEHGLTPTLWILGAAYVLLIVIFSGCVWGFIVLGGRLATGVAYDLRQAAFGRLQELSFSYFDVRPVGWLVTRLTSDCSKLSSLMPWFMLDLVWGTFTITGIIGAMLWLDAGLALAVMAIVPPLVVVSVFFQRRLLNSSRHIRRTNSQITANYNECIQGVRTTKTLVRENANLGEFQELSTSMELSSMRNALQSAVYLPAVIVLGSVGVGLALWRGGVQMQTESGLTLGTLVAFMQYAGLFAMPIQELARRFTELQSAQAAAERVQGLLDQEPEISDSAAVIGAMETHVATGEPHCAPDGGPHRIETIEFRNVVFRYTDGETVLDGFDFTVHAGQTVALVGPTGGGKTTIVNLVARFYEVSQGAVLINGTDIRQRSLRWLQSNLGVVLQTPHLFSGSIRQNIRYGDLDATDEAVEAAARLSGAHDFIAGLDAGYDAAVGEGGTRLSTGQRQLISLARAILADPQVFIMDEATSSVDTETERLIQAGIEAVLGGRIAFVIAHRLSTIRRADLILVIDGGRIVERGKHEQLIAARGKYHALYTRQYQRERSLIPGL